MHVVLVRHADAGDKHAWVEPDLLRPLSLLGSMQAALGVAPFLAGVGVTRLLSSPAVRCLQTLAPAADALGLTVEAADELAVTAPGSNLLRLLERRSTQGAALCTHGEALTSLSAAWRAAGVDVVGPDGAPVSLAATPKGAAWVVDGAGRRQLTARLVPTHQVAPERDSVS